MTLRTVLLRLRFAAVQASRKDRRCHFAAGAFLLLLVTPLCAAENDALDYNRDIRPLLSDKCFVCHGPDSGTREAELRLDTRSGATSPLASDADLVAVRPGHPEQSEVYRRITAEEDYMRMPPPDSNLSLTKEQIDLLRRWIASGADYEEHWSFVPPRKSALPETSSNSWVRNEIDAFVLQQMQAHELKPNPPASKEKLLRRVSFDLTGLPPTLAEIDAFLADDSADAFETVVDRLLASERFGERMAAEWLDVARYSDTYGFQVDRDRFVWPWRDWVIRSFNAGLPYDEFIVQQIAGDLLPHATQDEILATTFCRLHPQEAEGGSIPEEYRVSYVADRLQTVSTAFLGLTFECARCHDHKFDPISQKDYFGLFAFFDDIDEAGLYSYFTDAIPTPTLLLTDEAQRKQLAKLDATIAARERDLEALHASRRENFLSWWHGKPVVPETFPGEVAHITFDDVKAPNQSVAGRVGQAIKLTGDDEVVTKVGNFHRYEPFSVSLWINAPHAEDRAVIFHRSRAWTDAGSRGYELLMMKGKLSAALVHFDPGNSLRVETRDPLPIQRWVHVAVTYDGSSRADGLRIFLDGEPAKLDFVRDKLTKDVTGGGGDHIGIGARFRDHGLTDGMIDEMRVFDRELSAAEASHLAGDNWLAQAFSASSLPPAEEARLYDYYLKAVDEESATRRASLKAARQRQSELIEAIPEIMVMREMAEPKPAYVLERGEYNHRGEPVSAHTPEAFFPQPESAPRNRLGLARWIVDPQNPLTARVAVNRYWQLLFGTGLVVTTEDFGNQGQAPTHPRLLDWLARDFVEHGWNVKRLLKQMILSATYQQSSAVSAEQVARDPENHWLSRAASYRLPAEMLRDNALAVSGLLVPTIGGPPAKPYEVEVAFKPLTPDTGAGLYRRSLYTYWSRTGPAPVMMTLDAAKRDVCQVRRERTLSPLQPLVMLNGPQFVEAARTLAERVLQDGSNEPDDVLTDLFRWTTSRSPTDAELKILRKLYEQNHAEFTAAPEQAQAFLSVGDHPPNELLDPIEVAAWAGVANLLLNLDDCVFRR